ncbi:50S ribosomal protein L25 [Patescibacteria group bacterium]|nr:50S ribosomal protein L25 [Patescibacteria group bacterium]
MIELKTEKRTVLGRASAALREKGLVPAELYGHGVPNVHLAVDGREFEQAFKVAGENTVINMLVDGKPVPVLIYYVNRDRVKDQILAIDFYKVNMKEKLQAEIPLHFEGESPAVKEGGILIKAMDGVRVEALPQDLPEYLAVDLSKLNKIGDSIYVRDLVQSDKFEYLVEAATVVASITEQAEEEVAAPTVTPEEVVVETEEKKAERDQAKAAESSKGESK